VSSIGFKLVNSYIVSPSGTEGRVDHGDAGATTNYFYIKDHLGSTREIISDNSEVVKADMYFAYGAMKPIIESGLTTRNRKDFTAKEFDNDGSDANGENGMGLFYFGARYYDPEIIMWTSPDPVEEFWNSYSYCGGNPINFVDPLGLSKEMEDLCKDFLDFFGLSGNGDGDNSFDPDKTKVIHVTLPNEAPKAKTPQPALVPIETIDDPSTQAMADYDAKHGAKPPDLQKEILDKGTDVALAALAEMPEAKAAAKLAKEAKTLTKDIGKLTVKQATQGSSKKTSRQIINMAKQLSKVKAAQKGSGKLAAKIAGKAMVPVVGTVIGIVIDAGIGGESLGSAITGNVLGTLTGIGVGVLITGLSGGTLAPLGVVVGTIVSIGVSEAIEAYMK
jgi:RHS repeat-associated protein